MKVHVQAPRNLSQAMYRVTRQLERFSPFEVVEHRDDADCVVLHVIGYPETAEEIRHLLSADQSYALIQYCLRTTQRPSTVDWLPFWQVSDAVWSYYDLRAALNEDHALPTLASDWSVPIYHAPLGVDPVFTRSRPATYRDIDIFTSGYVSAWCAEAIEEVALAAADLGLSVCHLGPPTVEGMDCPPPGRWQAVCNIPDETLATLYGRARWVSGLRHGEGFELPALEGLCCGARPIVFDRPDMRAWYDGHAEFVPECSGPELIDHLKTIFSKPPRPVTWREREHVIEQFDWKPIARGFWECVGDHVQIATTVGR